MKTIGQYLREARIVKKMTLEELSNETKIRREFLAAIEKEEWDTLPEFPVVVGFVKNVASAVEMNREQAVALLRRDFPPKSVPIAPKPDIPKEFRLSPRFLFMVGAGLIVLVILGYLVLQYIIFSRPPSLRVDEPIDGARITAMELVVSGKTDPDTTVIVNTQPALVTAEGKFQTKIDITDQVTVVEIVATSRAGKVTKVTRTIRPELTKE